MRAALLAYLAVLLSAAPARAGTNSDSDVGVVVVGEATMQPQLAAQLEAWLRQHGRSVSPAPLPPNAITGIVDCFVVEDEVCASKVVQNFAKSRVVVFARVDLKAESAERTVTITVYWFEKGQVPVAERRFCERCTEALVRSTADDLMGAIAATQAKSDGKVKISSTPAGARVAIDGEPKGVTPLELALPAGKHAITLTTAGHTTEARDVEVKRGETAEVDILMKGAISTNFFPLVLLGTGGALLATGLVLFAIDEDEPKPVGEQKEFYRNTGPLGVGLAISGVVVGGIGGYLLFRSKRVSAPVASVTPESAYVGWAGTF